jgi:hypothetical protein
MTQTDYARLSDAPSMEKPCFYRAILRLSPAGTAAPPLPLLARAAKAELRTSASRTHAHIGLALSLRMPKHPFYDHTPGRAVKLSSTRR